MIVASYYIQILAIREIYSIRKGILLISGMFWFVYTRLAMPCHALEAKTQARTVVHARSRVHIVLIDSLM